MDTVSRVVFSPDGQRILTASDDGTVRMWNSTSGELLGILQGHTGEITSVSFFPDGQRIATSSKDQTARIWQILTLDDIERILTE